MGKVISGASENNLSNGMYLEFSTFDKDETISFLDNDNLFSPFDDYKTKMFRLIDYRDTIARQYTKIRLNRKHNGETYRNIYSYGLKIMLPYVLPKNQSYDNLVSCFLNSIDEGFKSNLLWCYCISTSVSDRCKYANILLFTRAYIDKPIKESETYDSDYYWNPNTKRRTKKTDPDAILRHHIGEVKYDSEGNPITRIRYCDTNDKRIFTYTSGSFENLINYLKNKLYTCFRLMKASAKSYNIFKKITFKKSFKQSTLLKVKRRNQLINEVNKRLSDYCDASVYASMCENELFVSRFYSLTQKLNTLLYCNHFKYNGLSIDMTYRGYYTKFKENLTLLENTINNAIYEFETVYTHILSEYGYI